MLATRPCKSGDTRLTAASNRTHTLRARVTHGPGVDEPWLLERDLNANGLFDPDEVFTYHADALGSIVSMTDSTGAEVRTARYDTFGNLLAETGTLQNPYGFTGRERDQESGLYYYRARYYDPKIGRFLQEDPIGFAGGDVNLYGYVGNNPLLFVDPHGLLGTDRFWIPAGEEAGEEALEFYAGILTNTCSSPGQKVGAAVGGFFSALWTPETSNATALTLGGALLPTGAHQAFRPGGFLNRGPWLRVGFGQHQGREVFRAAGKIIDWLQGKPGAKIDFWKGGPL